MSHIGRDRLSWEVLLCGSEETQLEVDKCCKLSSGWGEEDGGAPDHARLLMGCHQRHMLSLSSIAWTREEAHQS